MCTFLCCSLQLFLTERQVLMERFLNSVPLFQKKDKKGKDKKKRKDKKSKEKKKEKKKKEKEKKKKEKEKKPERRPFDRDLDLKVNQFDDAMRKRYIKSAQGLGGKFGHSGSGKYL